MTFGEIHLWTHPEKVTPAISAHLQADGCDDSPNPSCVTFRDWSTVVADLSQWAGDHSDAAVLVTSPSMYSGGSSFAVYEAFPVGMARFDFSPLVVPRAIKNEVKIIMSQPCCANGNRN